MKRIPLLLLTVLLALCLLTLVACDDGEDLPPPETEETVCDPHTYNRTVLTSPGPLKNGRAQHICSICNHSYMEMIPPTKSIKILALGNGYSEDGVCYLYDVLKDVGLVDIEIVNLYANNAGIWDLGDDFVNDTSDYVLARYSPEARAMVTDSEKRSIKYAMDLLDFDIITLEERPGRFDNYLYYRIEKLIEYLRINERKANFYWHMTWAFGPENRSLYRYGSQVGMYEKIAALVSRSAVTYGYIREAIPVGTTVQNMRTSILGNDLTRDGIYLDDLARYAAAMTWAATLTGCDVADIDGVLLNPEADATLGVTIRENMHILRECVQNALDDPFNIHVSQYAPEPEPEPEPEPGSDSLIQPRS